MDVGKSFPLVPFSPSSEDGRALVPVSTEVVPTLDEPAFEFPAWLRRRLLLLIALLLFAVRMIRAMRLELVWLRQQAHYWHSQHRRAKQREEKLQLQVEQLQAQIRDLEKRLYGRKSETTTATAPSNASRSPMPKKPRGQQRGAKGPSRRNYDHLPTTHEPCIVPPEQRLCGTCGAPWRRIRGTRDGQILEIEVRAHRRVYHRERYERT
jgi:hypothetical protein